MLLLSAFFAIICVWIAVRGLLGTESVHDAEIILVSGIAAVGSFWFSFY
jgi:hypothetical protein